MNRFYVLTALLVLGSSGICQTANTSRTDPGFGPKERAFCPVEIKAVWPESSAKVRPVPSGIKQPQTLQVTFNNSRSLAVRETRVTVYGFPSGAYAQPAVLYSLGANPLEVWRSFTFDRRIEPGQSTAVDLSVPNVGTLTGINLDSVVYADGSSWHPSFDYPCQALNKSNGKAAVLGR
jgi:hypothetical protein